MLFDLRRHESNTLLRAVQTAKDLPVCSCRAEVRVDHLKNSPLAIYYYIIDFKHNYI